MKSMTIGRKIGLGFTALILLSGLLGGLAIVTMRTVQSSARALSTQYVPEANIGTALEMSIWSVQLAIRSYGFTAEPRYLEEARKGLKEVRHHLAAAQKLSDSYPTLVKLREDLAKIRPALLAFEKSIAATEEQNTLISAQRETMNAAAADFIVAIDRLIESQRSKLHAEMMGGNDAPTLQERLRKLMLTQEIRGHGNAARIAVFKAQALRDATYCDEALKAFETMTSRFAELREALRAKQDIDELNHVKTEAQEYRDALAMVRTATAQLEQIATQRLTAATTLLKAAEETQKTGMKRTVDAADSSDTRLTISAITLFVGVGVTLAIGFGIAFFIIRGTSRVLSGVANHLDEASEHVTAAAGQVASAAQTLAEASTEQAAGLEETSASLEEMSSMTKRNADSAQEAKALSNETRSSADVGATHMEEMRTAMAAIKASSDDIAKIIKTIDEIAFQTNILALNAAVEAARAGEAGLGFAVVADEVRNLAQRSAQSAKETADKIEDAIRKSEHGVAISSKVADALSDIVTKARRMDQLVVEIATASSEQNQGIGQINGGVTQLDKVTQSNASTAEESAAAAEELNAQAASMQQAVAELRQLVSGDKAHVIAAKAKDTNEPSERKAQASCDAELKMPAPKPVTAALERPKLAAKPSKPTALATPPRVSRRAAKFAVKAVTTPSANGHDEHFVG